MRVSRGKHARRVLVFEHRYRVPMPDRLATRQQYFNGARERMYRLFALASLGFLPPPTDGMQSLGRMRFLSQSILAFAPRAGGDALELGCYMAGSTVYLAKASAKRGVARVSAIDLFTGTADWGQAFDTFEAARNRLDRAGLGNVTLIRSDTQAYEWTAPLAVLHVDADHAYEAVRADIAKYVPLLVPGGIVVFDDYDRSHSGVQHAVHELLANDSSLQIVAVHYEGPEWGSICLKRIPAADR